MTVNEKILFDALKQSLSLINDSWSEAGNNCIIKWNAKRRRVEVWTIVDVPLYKELGAAYNDPYWYRPKTMESERTSRLYRFGTTTINLNYHRMVKQRWRQIRKRLH